MRVRLKLVLDCPPGSAWELVRSPAGLSAVSAPLLAFRSLEPGGFPARWSEGDHPVAVRAFGALPAGEQVIAVSFREHRGARIMTDDGGPTAGPLTMLTRWRHQLAVAPAPGDPTRTLYRDQLEFSAGRVTALAWVGLWVFWQWRGIGLRRLARRRG